MSNAIITDVSELVIDDLWTEIERLQAERGWTHIELADRAGLNPETLRVWRRRSPKQIKMCEAARLFRTFGWELSLTLSKAVPA